MAATIIQDHTPYECIVIGVNRENDKAAIKEALAGFFGAQQPVIGFSMLSGREDLFALAKELKDEGAITILAGPQADVDFSGEKGRRDHPHRFKGLSENFTFGLRGGAELVVLRSVLSTTGHVAYACIWGFYYGAIRFGMLGHECRFEAVLILFAVFPPAFPTLAASRFALTTSLTNIKSLY